MSYLINWKYIEQYGLEHTKECISLSLILYRLVNGSRADSNDLQNFRRQKLVDLAEVYIYWKASSLNFAQPVVIPNTYVPNSQRIQLISALVHSFKVKKVF